MGVITDYFAVTETVLGEMDFTNSPVTYESARGVAAKGIDDAVMLRQLESVITGEPYETISARVGPPPVFIGGEEGPWVVRVSTHFRDAIGRLPEERVEEVARAWFDVGDFYCDDDAEFVVEFVRDMRTLARQAIVDGATICCWMSL